MAHRITSVPINVDIDMIEEAEDWLNTARARLRALDLMKRLNDMRIWGRCDSIQLRFDYDRTPPRRLKTPQEVRTYRLPFINTNRPVELALGQDGIFYRLTPSPLWSDQYGLLDIQPPYPLLEDDLEQSDLCRYLDAAHASLA